MGIRKAIAPRSGFGVMLRLLEESDLPMTRAWRNQDRIRRWFFDAEPITEERHAAWWRTYVDKDDDYVFVVEEMDVLRRPVGQVALYHIDWTRREGEYGRCLVGPPEASGRNILRRASLVLFDIARDTLGLGRLVLDVKADNAKAIHVYGRLGFRAVRWEPDAVSMELILG